MTSPQYYVYKVTRPQTGEYYFGSRTCYSGCVDKDKYYGSGLWPKEMLKLGTDLKKEIVKIFECVSDARKNEALLIEKYRTDKKCRNIRPGSQLSLRDLGIGHSVTVCFRTTEAVFEYLTMRARSNGATVSNEIHALCEKDKRKADRSQ